MPSTYSPSLRIELIGAGEQSGTWGTTTNTNLGTLLEQSIAGVQAITMSNANYTLSNFNGVSDEARRAVLVVSGTNAAIRDVIAPLVTKAYTIKNNTTGGFAINIRAATGASVSIPNGVTSLVYCDGTNFNLAGNQTSIAAGYGISIAVVGATTTITNSIFPAGTTTNFYQAAAPTGWVQRTDLNDFMLYIVSGAGGYGAGSNSPTVMNVVPYHTHGFSTGGMSADHSHNDSGHQHSNGFAQYYTAALGYYGWTGTGDRNTGTGYAALGGATSDHTHSGGTDGGSSQSNWAPRYLANIMCYKS